jgi:hypothetical protein
MALDAGAYHLTGAGVGLRKDYRLRAGTGNYGKKNAGRKAKFTAERKRELQERFKAWAHKQPKRPHSTVAVCFVRDHLLSAEVVADSTIKADIIRPVMATVFRRKRREIVSK